MVRRGRALVTMAACGAILASSGLASDAPYYFALARMYVAEGAVERAANAFRKAIELEPGDSYLRLEHAEFLSRRGLMRQAVREVETALELDENNLEAVRLLGYLYLELAPGDARSIRLARGAFERLREADPSDVASMLTLSRIYARIGETGRALEVLRDAYDYAPDHPAIKTRLLEAVGWTENQQQAEEILDRLLERDPSFLEARIAKARQRIAAGDHAGAVAVLEARPDDGAPPGEAEYLLALELYRTATGPDVPWTGRQVGLERSGEVLDRLLLASPDNYEAIFLKALQTAERNRTDEAIRQLFDLRSHAPDGLQRRIAGKLAELLEHQGRTEEAAQVLFDLADALDGAVDDPSAGNRILLEVAHLYARESQWAELSGLAARLRRSDDAEFREEGTLLAAESLLRQDRHGDAIDLLESFDGEGIRIGLKTAEAYFAAGRDQQAHRALAQLARGNDLESLLAVADTYLRRLDHESVVPVLERALGQMEGAQPDLERQLVLLYADSLGRIGKPEAGLAILDERRVQLEDLGEIEDQRVRLTRAALLEKAGRVAELEAIETEIASQTEIGPVLLTVERYQEDERFTDMIPLLQGAIDAMDPGEISTPVALNVLFALGMAHERTGDIAAAETAFRSVLATNPDDGRTLNYLGYIWAERGINLAEALEMISRAVKLEPRNGAYLDSLGWVYYQLARYEEALDPLEEAASLDPDDPTILEHMGDLYLALEQPDRARQLYQRAMEASGENVEGVRQKLARLETDDS